ncbi:hypothetical protein [Flavobacterium sp.]|uniref:hypothetical protein n=1 Tax=Flavobacterium sp. TaxID=239 RepID=UPI004048AEF9
MNKFLILCLSIHFFASCQKKQSLNLNDIKIVNNLVYNSLKEKISDKPLNESFKNILGKNSLYSKNGEYWENMKFNLYPICLVNNNQIKTIFVLKEIQLMDGKLSELYLIKVNQNDDLIDCKKIAKQESNANCESDFILTINKAVAEITQNETCEIGSQNDDENEETTKTNSVKTLITLNK